MMEEVQAWLQHSEGPLAYLLLAAASGIEYLVPPFPGDTVALFGVFLAATAGYRVGWVYLALNAGAVAGGMSVYALGRWIGAERQARTPRWLRGPRASRAIERVIARFERHGAVYLALNRFVPAFRSFFFLGAGIARLEAWKVLSFGALSALVWNALLLGLGWVAGASFERLQGWVATYSYLVFGGLALLGLAMLWRRWRVRRAAEASEGTEPVKSDRTD